MEGPIAEEGLSDRVGMRQLPGGGERLALPHLGLLRVAEGEERLREPEQADYARVDGVDEARAPVSHRVVEGERAL